MDWLDTNNLVCLNNNQATRFPTNHLQIPTAVDLSISTPHLFQKLAGNPTQTPSWGSDHFPFKISLFLSPPTPNPTTPDPNPSSDNTQQTKFNFNKADLVEIHLALQ